MALIKKIFESFNLMGNRIKNFVIDEPTKEQSPTTKKYVDKKTILDTENSNLYKKPFGIESLKDFEVDKKEVVDILDKFLFTPTNPEYILPYMEIVSAKKINSNANNIISEQLNIFNDELAIIELLYKCAFNDFNLIADNNIQIVFITETNSEIIGSALLTNTEYKFSVNIPKNVKIKNMFFRFLSNGLRIVKQNEKNEDYYPLIFQPNSSFETEKTNLDFEINYLDDFFVVYKKLLNNGNDFDTENISSLILNEFFVKAEKNSILFPVITDDNIFDAVFVMLFPENYINNFDVQIYDNLNNTKFVDLNLNLYKTNKKINNGITYQVYEINLKRIDLNIPANQIQIKLKK